MLFKQDNSNIACDCCPSTQKESYALDKSDLIAKRISESNWKIEEGMGGVLRDRGGGKNAERDSYEVMEGKRENIEIKEALCGKNYIQK